MSSRPLPILLLITINILAGVLVFRNYGYSWDEPLFYDYGKALAYAYSPSEWLGGEFDLEGSFGASGDDHKTRGPAYLLLAAGPVRVLQAAGLDTASAWHLINFLFFQIGVYFFYRFSRRWMSPGAALSAAALFSLQPLLWGHAFINPKDVPFLVFFLISVCLGFEMADAWALAAPGRGRKWWRAILPGAMLGITTSIRVLGPLAAVLVIAYSAFRSRRRLSGLPAPLALYGLCAAAVMLVTWPYLWSDPVTNFVEVFRLMSDNPTGLSVLFDGEVYRAGELPRAYLPFMLLSTLTEPVWLLFLTGLGAGFLPYLRQRPVEEIHAPGADLTGSWARLRSSIDLDETGARLVSLALLLLWFGIMLAYVLLRRPAMYDGMRHFLFILPPVFVFVGLAFDLLHRLLASSWLYATVVVLLLAPGVLGIVRLHPYEYAYYNSLAGGMDGAFRRYETEYWLTCYREAVEALEQRVAGPLDLFVHREAYIARYYAAETTTVHELRGALDDIQPGDFVLVNSRTNEDRRVFRDAPTFLKVGRGRAVFCEIKKIP